MRGKRSRQYRKLIKVYELTFGFREPYQVIVDAQMIQDAGRYKMDLIRGLERTLHGKVKPMITQCSIRHLYTIPNIPQPQKDALIATAKGLERRRCNHHGLENPLSTLECLASVVDPKGSRTNKNRYVVASQEEEVRRYCRSVKGVPLVYVRRSVMIMEPMADSSVGVREGMEKGKFRSGLRANGRVVGSKRKRESSIDAESGNVQDGSGADDRKGTESEQAPKKKKLRGPKGPNPLSVKKPKREKHTPIQRDQDQDRPDVAAVDAKDVEAGGSEENPTNIIEGTLDETQDPPKKRKRKRKHKIASLNDNGGENDDNVLGDE